MIKKLLALAAVAAAVGTVNAQRVTQSYLQVIGNAPYNQVTGDTTLNGTVAADDNLYPGINLGFSFPYNGQTYTQANVSINGFISLGSTTATSSGGGSSFIGGSVNGIALWSYTAAPNARVIPVIAGFSSDLHGNSAIGAGSALTLTRRGTAGAREAVFQWRNYSRYNASTLLEDINFQIILKESGEINIHYGTATLNSTGPTSITQAGIRGADTTDVLSVTGTWNSLTRSQYARDGVTTDASNFPAAGTLITYSQGSGVDNDVAVSSIIKPVQPTGTSCSSSISDSVSALVVNLGNLPVSSVPMGYTINGGTPVTQTFNFATPLTTGQSAVVTFSQIAVLTGAPSYTVRVFTALPGETPSSVRNDTATRVYNVSGSVAAPVYPMWKHDFGSTLHVNTVPSWTQTFLSGNMAWGVDTSVFLSGSAFNRIFPLQNKGFAWVNSFSSTSRGNQTRLESACLDLGNWNANEPVWMDLTFSQTDEFPNRRDSLFVQVSTDGTNWTTLAGIGRYNAAVVADWTHFTADLSAYRGQIVKVGILAKSAGGGSMAIDYVRVMNAVPTSIGGLTKGAPIRLYPNPVKDIARVDLPSATKYSRIAIVNMLGQELMSAPVDGPQAELNLSALTPGVYQVCATGDNVQFTTTVTKR